MAVEKFSFIKGDKIENAIEYSLYSRKTGVDNPNVEPYKKIATQNFLQTFDIPGAITLKGKPHESRNLDIYAFRDFVYTTITRERAFGPEYYLSFWGYMNVRTDEREFTDVPFRGILNFPSFKKIQLYGDHPCSLSVESDGIYLSIYWNEYGSEEVHFDRILVYQLDSSQQVEDVYFGNDDITYIPLYVGDAGSLYHRTTFIPIDSLTNDLNGGCVGYFERYEHELSVYKMVFYDENFAFLHGVNYGEIKDLIDHDISSNASPGYVTVEQVKKLGVNQAAKYVIFCSAVPGVEGTASINDQVSIGNIYFPLFNYPYEMFNDTGFYTQDGNTKFELHVVAEGDGLFFTDSLPSTPDVIYVRPKKEEAPVG